VAKVQKLVNRGNPKPNGKTKSTKKGESQMERIKNFFKDESGASAVEYGLLVALIAVGLITAMTTLKDNISTSFTNAGTALTGGS
jgi:pilus assembly protein Flp/PilA